MSTAYWHAYANCQHAANVLVTGPCDDCIVEALHERR